MCPSAVNKSKWLLADCSIGMYDLVAQACLKTAYACELVLSSEDHVMSLNYLPTFHVATQGQAICYFSTFCCCCRCVNVKMSNLSLMNHSALRNVPPCIHLSLHSCRHEFYCCKAASPGEECVGEQLQFSSGGYCSKRYTT